MIRFFIDIFVCMKIGNVVKRSNGDSKDSSFADEQREERFGPYSRGRWIPPRYLPGWRG